MIQTTNIALFIVPKIYYWLSVDCLSFKKRMKELEAFDSEKKQFLASRIFKEMQLKDYRWSNGGGYR